MMTYSGAPGYTSGASIGTSSMADAAGPAMRSGAPRSSVALPTTRASVHGARGDAPGGGGSTTSPTIPTPGTACQPMRIADGSPARPPSIARPSAGGSHTGTHGSAAVSDG